VVAVQYTGDDSTVYQIEQPADYSAPGAGDLPPATGSEPLFTALYNPRHFVAFPSGGATGEYVKICCDITNLIYLAGRGAVFTMGGVGYIVLYSQGESRPQI
jgi:hypothetical protein